MATSHFPSSHSQLATAHSNNPCLPAWQDEAAEGFGNGQDIRMLVNSHKQVALVQRVRNGDTVQVIVFQCMEIRDDGYAVAWCDKAGHVQEQILLEWVKPQYSFGIIR